MFGEPMRMPVFVVSDPKAVWMNFLSHICSVGSRQLAGSSFLQLPTPVCRRPTVSQAPRLYPAASHLQVSFRVFPQ